MHSISVPFFDFWHLQQPEGAYYADFYTYIYIYIDTYTHIYLWGPGIYYSCILWVYPIRP